jgi:hypothetical protein
MDMVEELPSKEWLEVEDMDMEHIDMMEDRTMEVEVVEREHKGVVLARHCIGELIGNGRSLQSRGCSQGHTTFACLDSNCSTLRRVEKRVEMG